MGKCKESAPLEHEGQTPSAAAPSNEASTSNAQANELLLGGGPAGTEELRAMGIDPGSVDIVDADPNGFGSSLGIAAQALGVPDWVAETTPVVWSAKIDGSVTPDPIAAKGAGFPAGAPRAEELAPKLRAVVERRWGALLSADVHIRERLGQVGGAIERFEEPEIDDSLLTGGFDVVIEPGQDLGEAVLDETVGPTSGASDVAAVVGDDPDIVTAKLLEGGLDESLARVARHPAVLPARLAVREKDAQIQALRQEYLGFQAGTEEARAGAAAAAARVQVLEGEGDKERAEARKSDIEAEKARLRELLGTFGTVAKAAFDAGTGDVEGAADAIVDLSAGQAADWFAGAVFADRLADVGARIASCTVRIGGLTKHAAASELIEAGRRIERYCQMVKATALKLEAEYTGRTRAITLLSNAVREALEAGGGGEDGARLQQILESIPPVQAAATVARGIVDMCDLPAYSTDSGWAYAHADRSGLDVGAFVDNASALAGVGNGWTDEADLWGARHEALEGVLERLRTAAG